MYDLDGLYQEIVLDHNRRPRNFKVLDEANRSSEGFNPLCGDQITLYLQLEDDGTISDVGFQAVGCAISKAAASMMTQSIKGKNQEQAREIFEAFRRMVTLGEEQDTDADTLGDLFVLAGVSRYPARVKCATLSWHTLRAALNGKQESRTSTE